MAITWNYDETQAQEITFEVIPVGEYRIRFEEIEEVKSKSGNDMLKINFSVSGLKPRLFHNLVFLPDRPEITNTNLKAIYDSFGVKGLNFQEWIGKVGACKVKHELYNGEPQARINYFIKKDAQDHLPAWEEKAVSVKKAVSNKDEDGIPF